jgi:hypothetical protein
MGMGAMEFTVAYSEGGGDVRGIVAEKLESGY